MTTWDDYQDMKARRVMDKLVEIGEEIGHLKQRYVEDDHLASELEKVMAKHLDPLDDFCFSFSRYSIEKKYIQKYNRSCRRYVKRLEELVDIIIMLKNIGIVIA